MAITVKVYNEPKVYYPSTMSQDELKWIIDYCDTSQRKIAQQLESNELDIEAGRPGRGAEWEYKTRDARERYIVAQMQFKEYLEKENRQETEIEFNDLFVSVARELLEPELYQRIADATQDRMGA